MAVSFFPLLSFLVLKEDGKLNSKTMQRVLTTKLWENLISSHSTGKKKLDPAYHNIRRIPDIFLSNILLFSPKIATMTQASKTPGDYPCFWPEEPKLGKYKMNLAWNMLWCQKAMPCSKNNGGIFKTRDPT